METIKKSPNVEFEVIYADGERKRVQEGVLLGVEDDGSITMHNGTDCAAVWFAAADGMLVALNACNALPAFARNRMQDPVSLEALKIWLLKSTAGWVRVMRLPSAWVRWIFSSAQLTHWKLPPSR